MERSHYIYAILRGVLNIFKDVILRSQYYVSGSEGKGRVDFAISYLEEILCITEAKRLQAEEGIANNFVQLQSACQVYDIFWFDLDVEFDVIKKVNI